VRLFFDGEIVEGKEDVLVGGTKESSADQGDGSFEEGEPPLLEAIPAYPDEGGGGKRGEAFFYYAARKGGAASDAGKTPAL